jgi:hypothetical protein
MTSSSPRRFPVTIRSVDPLDWYRLRFTKVHCNVCHGDDRPGIEIEFGTDSPPMGSANTLCLCQACWADGMGGLNGKD